MSSTFSQRKHVIKQASLDAGKFIKNAEPTDGIVYKEGRGNFVTTADMQSEKIVIDLIKQHFPNDLILSEESNNDLKDILSVENLWIIDPIDGTNNFAHHRNYSCISIGYAEKGILQLGAVYNPFSDELFFAEKDTGAFLNDKKVSISDKQDITKAYVCTDNSYSPEKTRRHIELVLAIEPTPFTFIKGSAALTMCEVAAGRMDLYFHTCINAWDTAAGLLMIQEAGGVAKNFAGKVVTFDSPEIIVGNETIVDSFIPLTQKEHIQ